MEFPTARKPITHKQRCPPGGLTGKDGQVQRNFTVVSTVGTTFLPASHPNRTRSDVSFNKTSSCVWQSESPCHPANCGINISSLSRPAKFIIRVLREQASTEMLKKKKETRWSNEGTEIKPTYRRGSRCRGVSPLFPRWQRSRPQPETPSSPRMVCSSPSVSARSGSATCQA